MYIRITFLIALLTWFDNTFHLDKLLLVVVPSPSENPLTASIPGSSNRVNLFCPLSLRKFGASFYKGNIDLGNSHFY